jgi:hypothetical protein
MIDIINEPGGNREDFAIGVLVMENVRQVPSADGSNGRSRTSRRSEGLF